MIFSGSSSVPFFPADTYSVVFQLGGIFLAVPGTSFVWRYRFRRFPVLRNMAVPISAVPGTAKYGRGDFLAVMQYGGTFFAVPGI